MAWLLINHNKTKIFQSFIETNNADSLIFQTFKGSTRGDLETQQQFEAVAPKFFPSQHHCQEPLFVKAQLAANGTKDALAANDTKHELAANGIEDQLAAMALETARKTDVCAYTPLMEVHQWSGHLTSHTSASARH